MSQMLRPYSIPPSGAVALNGLPTNVGVTTVVANAPFAGESVGASTPTRVITMRRRHHLVFSDKGRRKFLLTIPHPRMQLLSLTLSSGSVAGAHSRKT